MAEDGGAKIPFDIAVQMVVLAVIFDLTNIAIEYETFFVGGILIDFCAAMTFWLWLSEYDVHLWGSKNLGWSLGTVVLDALPFGDLFFPWTFRIATLVFVSRKQTSKSVEMQFKPSWFRL